MSYSTIVVSDYAPNLAREWNDRCVSLRDVQNLPVLPGTVILVPIETGAKQQSKFGQAMFAPLVNGRNCDGSQRIVVIYGGRAPRVLAQLAQLRVGHGIETIICESSPMVEHFVSNRIAGTGGLHLVSGCCYDRPGLALDVLSCIANANWSVHRFLMEAAGYYTTMTAWLVPAGNKANEDLPGDLRSKFLLRDDEPLIPESRLGGARERKRSYGAKFSAEVTLGDSWSVPGYAMAALQCLNCPGNEHGVSFTRVSIDAYPRAGQAVQTLRVDGYASKSAPKSWVKVLQKNAFAGYSVRTYP